MTNNVFITGASSGLGLSHAIYLTSKGFNVTGTTRKADQLDLTVLKEIYIRDHTRYKFVDKNKTRVKPSKVIIPDNIRSDLINHLKQIDFITMDITDIKSVKKVVDEQIRIDILINNAGFGYFGSIEELTLEMAKYQFDVNFFGFIRVLQEIIPNMRQNMNGRIINTASLGGISCIPFQAHYSASKAAILILTEGLRVELKPFNIFVSSLVPGDINTAFDANTVISHNHTKSVSSIDIADLKDSIPVLPDSPYYERANIAWNSIIQNLIVSPPPITVSKKIEKIIRAKRPKIHYKVGSRLQTQGVTLIKRLLPENISSRIVAMFYGL
ncbi:MAG: SDR family NAD(P)-dependent oxidoreductase [Candidatus Hodarchaeota archaeon]